MPAPRSDRAGGFFNNLIMRCGGGGQSYMVLASPVEDHFYVILSPA